jgi:uncharacterized iron-regulated membrane protein
MIDFFFVLLIILGCFSFCILGLSGRLHWKKKNKGKGDGGW